MKNKMIFINYECFDGAMNMALDEELLNDVKNDKYLGVIRLYGWSQPTITIGYSQKIATINLDECSKDDVQVTRRLTGGRAVLHNNEITYLIALKKKNISISNRGECFTEIANIIIKALHAIGINSKIIGRSMGSAQNPNCFNTTSMYEIVDESNRKLVGSSMLIKDDVIFQQGSIPIDFGYKDISKYIIEPEKLKPVLNKETNKSSTSIGELINCFSPKELTDKMREVIVSDLNISYISMEEQLFLRAQKLAFAKYRTEEWIKLH